MFLICSVDNGGTTDFSDLLPMTVEPPATDLTRPNHVLDEEDSTTEPQRQLVEKFNVFQEVVIGCTKK